MMPHPMYKLEKTLEKFPQFGTAVESTGSEVEGNLFWVIGEMGIINLPRAIATIVDKNVSGTDAEKESVMIAALYLMAPQTLAADAGTAKYDAATQALLAEAAATTDKTAVLPTRMAQAVAAQSIALLHAQAPMMEGGPKDELPPAEMVQALKDGFAQADNIILPNLSSPGLQSAYEGAKQRLLNAIEPPAQPNGAPRKRANGFDL